MICSACPEDLGESVLVHDGEQSPQWKSCPHCSQREGKHVFYEYESFGFRDMNGRVRVQSWCGPCRSQQPAGAPSFTC